MGKYFDGPSGIYYNIAMDQIVAIRFSEVVRLWNKKTCKLSKPIRKYDVEYLDGNIRDVALTNAKGNLVYLDHHYEETPRAGR